MIIFTTPYVVYTLNPLHPDNSCRDTLGSSFLQAMIDGIGGEELQLQMQEGGHEKVLQELNNEASALRNQLIDSDPEGWKKFVESQDAAEKNTPAHRGATSGVTIE